MSPQTLTIGNLGLPAKVGRWIAQADIADLDQLLLFTVGDLLRLPSIGRREVSLIEAALTRHGLALRPSSNRAAAST